MKGTWVVITMDPLRVVANMVGPFVTMSDANAFIERHPLKFAELEKALNSRIPGNDSPAYTYAGYCNPPFWDTYPD